MLATISYGLRRFRGQIIGWGIAMFLIGLLLVPFYTTISENAAEFEALLDRYPPEFMAFFGNTDTLATPEGYLTLEYFSLLPLILGVYSILAGSGLIASEEEKGTLDLLMAYPISRTRAFFGRFGAFVVTTVAILFIAWIGLVVPATAIEMGLSPFELARPFVSLFAVLMVFGCVTLLFSVLLPSRRLASMAGGVVLVFSYFITSLARIDESLEPLARLSPMNYYESGDAISGLALSWVLGLLAVAAAATALSWWKFTRKDIRVAGEGGWSLPPLSHLLERQSSA